MVPHVQRRLQLWLEDDPLWHNNLRLQKYGDHSWIEVWYVPVFERWIMVRLVLESLESNVQLSNNNYVQTGNLDRPDSIRPCLETISTRSHSCTI